MYIYIYINKKYIKLQSYRMYSIIVIGHDPILSQCSILSKEMYIVF